MAVSGTAFMSDEYEDESIQFGLEDITFEPIEEIRSLKAGDQLFREGNLGVLYNHHGIFLGHEIGVAEFAWDSIGDPLGTLQIVDILSFWKREHVLYRVNYKEGKCLPNNKVVKRALEKVKSPKQWEKYNLQENNCEHFATWCKTGNMTSLQISEYWKSLLGNVKRKHAKDGLKGVVSSASS